MLILIIIFIVVIIVLFSLNRDSYVKEVPGKVVWLLWLQGWDKAPEIVKQVGTSWEKLNPDWTVIKLDENNLSTYINVKKVESIQAYSDIIRLALLAKHGGVWADATMLCMIPLDRWVYDAVGPTGFWMYHGRDEGRGPASWFMISTIHSSIPKKWSKASDEYWKNRKTEDDYFWMDGLFKKLVDTDPEFKAEWEKVPYLWCEDPGQAHMLAGKVGGNDPELQYILQTNPPYAVKLDHRNYGENARVAIKSALSGGDFPLHNMVTRGPENFSDSVAVVAACKDMSDIREICKKYSIELIVYEKCNFCKDVPIGVKCKPRRNVGREQETFLSFVVDNYDTLPNDILFVACPLSKHNRKNRIIRMIEGDEIGCNGSIENQADFQIEVYENNKMELASVRPFKKWYEHFLTEWKSDSNSACYNGVMKTTRERILSKPKEFYETLLREVSSHNNMEVGHFMERSMGSIF
jgi:hypothetical protein